MMETETVSGTLDYNATVTWIITQRDLLHQFALKASNCNCYERTVYLTLKLERNMLLRKINFFCPLSLKLL